MFEDDYAMSYLRENSKARDYTHTVSFSLLGPAKKKSNEELRETHSLWEALHRELDSCKWGQKRDPSTLQMFLCIPQGLCTGCSLCLEHSSQDSHLASSLTPLGLCSDATFLTLLYKTANLAGRGGSRL